MTGQDLLQDIDDDVCVTALTETRLHVKALQGLLASDVAVKIHKKAIEEFRSLRLDSSRAPQAVLASALPDVPYWKLKIAAWSTLMKTLSVQKVKLEDLAAFTNDAELLDIKVLCQNLADFTVLSEELPSDSVPALSTSLWTKVELAWHEFVKPAHDPQISMISMQELLKEVDLAWPLADQVKSWQSELAAIMVQATGVQRLTNMIASLTSLPTSKEGLHELNKQSQLDPALRVARDAAGVKISKKQWRRPWGSGGPPPCMPLRPTWESLSQMVLDHIRIMGDVFKTVLECFPGNTAMEGQLRNLVGMLQAVHWR